MEQLLTAYLAKTLNLAPESIAGMLYKKTADGVLTADLSETALDTILTADTDRVKKLRENADGGESFNNGHKKGKMEALEAFEKKVREKFQIDASDKAQGIDLIASVISKATTAATDEEKIKVSPIFLKMESEKNAAIEAALLDAKTQVEAIQTAFTRKETVKAVTEKARGIFAALNPVLSADPTKAATQTALFLKELEGFDYETTEGGNILVLKDGKRLETPQGHPIGLDALVKDAANSRFDFRTQDPKGNGGNKNDPNPPQITVPKNRAEYDAAMLAAPNAETRIALTAAFSPT